ncbi:LysR substrate-binding domain-containing protein [Acinetobacter baumannii]|uniref:LysR substrate-binding domain-containing protein n=2 Tax=Acinetobacter baumannii TaxID=470 RepID=UPI00062C2685|nr:LysR substrate-binding domain-containing protein [Acinetobacter baumannii]KKZ48132.1 LysR family transcriptional regulator [Acinetobacter baumannii]MCF4427554.1 LysR substrate-binding domain-containing protein [Acinetobacter baumannii]MCF4451483.1 LysR substrate-binding domain-containing protein [Acinetobacter baumannii]MCF4489176.1 LysR substrate-binding domain-containing protein [Acinetobacter baumannii]MCF4529546.1 LysR substrate-binding domain-containing protein [Acinetobacter baumannii
MKDLNDLYIFALIVEHGGLSKVEQKTGISKSKLSRRLSNLEKNLNVKLLQRDSRQIKLTAIGEQIYQYVQSMLLEAQTVYDLIDQLRGEPIGSITVSIPIDVAERIMPLILPEFMDRYPKVEIKFIVTNKRVDILKESVDIGIRIRQNLDSDHNLVMRHLGYTQSVLVASPQYLNQYGTPTHPSDLSKHKLLSNIENENQTWFFSNQTINENVSLPIKPFIKAASLTLLNCLATDGKGIALLPLLKCKSLILEKKLIVVLPEWELPTGNYHLIFPSRSGALPASKVFLDFLIEKIPPLLKEMQDI